MNNPMVHSQQRAPVRVVMAGPLPPAIGGMASFISDLYESRLRDAVTLDLFDTAKQTPAGRSLVRAVFARVRMWGRWWSLLRSGGRRIAHIHTCSGLSYFLDGALVLAARACRVPVVLHIHGGRFDKFLDELGVVRGWLARLIARSAARVVVLSEVWRERLERRLPGARLAIVANGVPVPARARQPGSQSEPVVLFLGAICAAKGVEDLVRAAARLTANARIALIGPETETGMLEKLHRLAAELGVAGRIDFVGPLLGAAKSAWLARATLFVLPSYVEALPISILEAMAAGCPVVATTVGAVPTVIRDDETGLLITPGDVGALAAAIDRLLSDGRLRDRLAARARRECVERFSIDHTVEQLSRIYSEIS